MSDISNRLRSAAAALVPTAVRTRFAAKFFAAVLLIMIVTSGVGAYNYVSAKDTVERQARDQLVSTAELQADGLQEWLSNVRLQTRTLSDAEAFHSTNATAVDQYLRAKEESYPDEVVAMHFVNVDSLTVVASSANGTAGTDLRTANVSWADDSLGYWLGDTSNVLVSTPYESVAGDETVVAFVSAVPGNDDHAVVVTATLAGRADSLHQTVAGGYTKVLNEDGRTILDSASGDEGGSGDGSATGDSGGGAAGINESAVVADGAESDRTGFVSGERTVAAYAPVDGSNWVVVTYAPKASAYAMRDAVATSLLSTVLTAVLVLGVVATAFGRRTARALRTLAAKAGAMEDGDLDVELETTREDELGRLYGAFDGMRASIREQIRAAESAQDSAESAREEAERERREAERARERADRMNDRLEATAAEYGDAMAECAEGDLTRRLDEETESDAMAEVAGSFNEMLDEWEATILHVRSFGEDAAAASERLTDRTAEVEGAGTEVSESVREISDGADAQDRRLREAAAEMNDLSATVEEISSATDEVAGQADAAAETGDAGRESATRALAELDAIESNVDATVETVERLDDEMADIEEVVDLISDIAEQTNMLALNANIEAARADAGGEGFAVVAEEVKSLADRTREATDDIEASIDRVRDRTETTVSEIRETREGVSEGAETVEAALEALDDVAAAVERTNDGLQEISDATESQAESAGEVVAMVEEVASIGEQTAAEADEAASAAEQQTTALAAVSDDVADVADRAERLRALLGEFDVAVDDTVEREASRPVRGDGGVQDAAPRDGGDGSGDADGFEYVESPADRDDR
ncbi:MULTISPECIES: methyl-accepting chemotaxis protein [Halorussus]|uniref:methyl-accepting chemotaxis protein n=1 Tax=Halorussus TaxID=1070314 RepID=UPI00209C9BF0|nr:methyl-accepting chemotaxis protein [Halorussus vallis]USZ74716.1 methyl-accepting chemotaxis protein [Halorussus vallis]